MIEKAVAAIVGAKLLPHMKVAGVGGAAGKIANLAQVGAAAGMLKELLKKKAKQNKNAWL